MQCHVRELNIGKCSLPIATHGLPTQANDKVSVFFKNMKWSKNVNSPKVTYQTSHDYENKGSYNNFVGLALYYCQLKKIKKHKNKKI